VNSAIVLPEHGEMLTLPEQPTSAAAPQAAGSRSHSNTATVEGPESAAGSVDTYAPSVHEGQSTNGHATGASVAFAGFAYTGAGNRINRVQLSLDGGATSHLAHTVRYPGNGAVAAMAFTITVFCWLAAASSAIAEAGVLPVAPTTDAATVTAAGSVLASPFEDFLETQAARDEKRDRERDRELRDFIARDEKRDREHRDFFARDEKRDRALRDFVKSLHDEHSKVLQDHSDRHEQLSRELREFMQQSFAERTSLNISECAGIEVCARNALLYFPSLECTGFMYRASTGESAVVTAAHCVADCAPLPHQDECTVFANALKPFQGVQRIGNETTTFTCLHQKVLKQRNTLTADVAVLDCLPLQRGARGAGAALRRRTHLPRMNSPVAIVGVAADTFQAGVQHFTRERSMRILSTSLVASAGTLLGHPSGSIQLASQSIMSATYYEPAGFTKNGVPRGMSGGVVLDGACAVLGVAVATAEHGVFASLDPVDDYLRRTHTVPPPVRISVSRNAEALERFRSDAPATAVRRSSASQLLQRTAVAPATSARTCGAVMFLESIHAPPCPQPGISRAAARCPYCTQRFESTQPRRWSVLLSAP
jgi:hypothetical protein